VKFDKSSKRVTQRMEDTASSAGFNRNFSNKKSNYRKNY
jgi:hypothetical protein